MDLTGPNQLHIHVKACDMYCFPSASFTVPRSEFNLGHLYQNLMEGTTTGRQSMGWTIVPHQHLSGFAIQGRTRAWPFSSRLGGYCLNLSTMVSVPVPCWCWCWCWCWWEAREVRQWGLEATFAPLLWLSLPLPSCLFLTRLFHSCSPPWPVSLSSMLPFLRQDQLHLPPLVIAICPSKPFSHIKDLIFTHKNVLFSYKYYIFTEKKEDRQASDFEHKLENYMRESTWRNKKIEDIGRFFLYHLECDSIFEFGKSEE